MEYSVWIGVVKLGASRLEFFFKRECDGENSFEETDTELVVVDTDSLGVNDESIGEEDDKVDEDEGRDDEKLNGPLWSGSETFTS